MAEPSITLYTGQSPNGVKISILLEELDLPYKIRKIDMTTTEQKSDWFEEINPNGRIPAITDSLEDGTQIRVFESGSIMQHLVDRYDIEHRLSYPRGTKEYIEVGLPSLELPDSMLI
jgi:glutathione S-transferase